MPRPNSNTATLRRLLQQQLAIGKRLVALAEESGAAIERNDAPALSALENEQRRCVEQQIALEEARVAVTRDLAFAAGMDTYPTLSDLLPHLPQREQESLQVLRLQLLETHERLRALDESNRLLLDNAMEYVRFSLEVLTNAVLQPARYGTNLASISAPTFYLDSKA